MLVSTWLTAMIGLIVVAIDNKLLLTLATIVSSDNYNFTLYVLWTAVCTRPQEKSLNYIITHPRELQASNFNVKYTTSML